MLCGKSNHRLHQLLHEECKPYGVCYDNFRNKRIQEAANIDIRMRTHFIQIHWKTYISHSPYICLLPCNFVEVFHVHSYETINFLIQVSPVRSNSFVRSASDKLFAKKNHTWWDSSLHRGKILNHCFLNVDNYQFCRRQTSVSVQRLARRIAMGWGLLAGSLKSKLEHCSKHKDETQNQISQKPIGSFCRDISSGT